MPARFPTVVKKKKKKINKWSLGKVPIQQKKSQYQWKSYESTLMLDFN